jgi:hypothetical protein
MQRGKGISVFATVLILCSHQAQPRLSALRDRGLRDQAAQDQLPGKIEPMRGKCVDDVAPNLLFESIEAYRRLRAALPGDEGHD